MSTNIERANQVSYIQLKGEPYQVTSVNGAGPETIDCNLTLDTLAQESGYLDNLEARVEEAEGDLEPLFSQGGYYGIDRRLMRGEDLSFEESFSALAFVCSVDTSRTDFGLTENAPEKIVELIRRFPNEITLLTLGPLSNVARSLRIDPEIANLTKEIVMMGGAIDVPGNKNRVAEFNFYVDPEAADIVFQSKTKKYLIPIDICNDMYLPLKQFDALDGSELYQPIHDMMADFIEGIGEDEGRKGALIYDAVAAYYLLNPEAFEAKPMNIVIETKGEHTFGMSVAEKRSKQNTPPNVDVCLSLDREKFIEDFTNIIIG